LLVDGGRNQFFCFAIHRISVTSTKSGEDTTCAFDGLDVYNY